MNYTADRVCKLENQLHRLLRAARDLGFNSEDANDIEFLFQELRFYAVLQRTPSEKPFAIERFTSLFNG